MQQTSAARALAILQELELNHSTPYPFSLVTRIIRHSGAKPKDLLFYDLWVYPDGSMLWFLLNRWTVV